MALQRSRIIPFILSAIVLGVLAIVELVVQGSNRITIAKAAVVPSQESPLFETDPNWPKIPNGWTMGQVASVASDAKDNIWVLQRPGTVRAGEKAAPPVMEFNQAGNYIKGWGGPVEGCDWPKSEHGIYIDYKGNVWIGGSGNEDQIIKLTQDGKCLLQIGHGGHKKTNADTENLWKPTDVFVYPKTNELFVSDGYGNRRIIVFDADTGRFKRMWGAFGNKPQDLATDGTAEESHGTDISEHPSESQRVPAKNLLANDPGPAQFETVHGVKVSRDGLVYVADRGGKRVQVFTTAGRYLKQVFVDRWCEAPGGSNLFCGNGQTAASVAFSADPEQRFLYVASRSPGRILVFDRKTLAPITLFGRPGVSPGEFYVLHQMTTDSKGNLYTAEVEDGRRVQRFVFKGLTSLSTKQERMPEER
jgi:DNA-binding beta-propeller fold protein YncE